MTKLIIITIIVSLLNVSLSITNNRFSSPSQLVPASPSELTKFLLYINNPQLRPREGRFRENLNENLRENLRETFKETNEKTIDIKDEFKGEGFTQQSESDGESKSDNKHHNKQRNGHHRDQRRVRFEKNLYDSNKSESLNQQPNWLPEQTIWRPYYLPRRISPPSFPNIPGHNLIPFQSGNLVNRMPPPYELFPPSNLNAQQPLTPRLPNQQPIQPPNRFNPVLVDNSGVFNVELVNGRFVSLDQVNFDNVHTIENLNNVNSGQINNEVEKEQPSLEKKVSDKLKLDNATNSDIQLINSMNTGDPQFVKPNSPLIKLDSSGEFTDPSINGVRTNSNHKIISSDPQLFINRIKQTIVTNESFTMQNPKSRPRLEEKANLANVSTINETSKILDTSPQQYSPVHFRQTFEQIQAQQKENQRFNQFTPLLYSNQKIGGQLNNNGQLIKPTTKSSLDVIVPPQLMNPISGNNLIGQMYQNTNGQLSNSQLTNQNLANAQLINAQQTSPSPIQPPVLMNPYNTPNILKRLQHQQQQQFQNALLARLGNHNNLNSIEAARRMNNNLIQERAIRERNNNSSVSLNSSPSSMDLAKNSKEFFTRRTNTHRYVIVSILIAAIAVISIGITVIYVKQRRLNLHNIHSNQNVNSEISNSYGVRRFYQRSSSSNHQASDSDSYGASYLSNRSVASVETGSTNTPTGPKALTSLRSNVIMHR